MSVDIIRYSNFESTILKKEYTNKEVFEFLTEECHYRAGLWERFGAGIESQSTDADFWASFSEHLDCLRICDECGKPMIEGYVVDGRDVYFSEECLHKHLTEEEFKYLYETEMAILIGQRGTKIQRHLIANNAERLRISCSFY